MVPPWKRLSTEKTILTFGLQYVMSCKKHWMYLQLTGHSTPSPGIKRVRLFDGRVGHQLLKTVYKCQRKGGGASTWKFCRSSNFSCVKGGLLACRQRRVYHTGQRFHFPSNERGTSDRSKPVTTDKKSAHIRIVMTLQMSDYRNVNAGTFWSAQS